MINQLAMNFYSTYSTESALNILKYCVNNKLYNLGIYLGEYFVTVFPHDINIRLLLASCFYFIKNYKVFYNMHKKILEYKNLPQDISTKLLNNIQISQPHIENNLNYYNTELVKKITSKSKKYKPLITLSITTCKRLDLFQKTVNSFINSCIDIEKIDEWLCVDDNSSTEDRERMKELYPFFDFYLKNEKEKGHPTSMNIIRKKVTTPYLFHMEDDWLFYEKKEYITDCLEILNQHKDIKQCLINKNYAELPKDINITGGLYNTTYTGLRYYIHEYCNTSQSKTEFIKKYGQAPNCNYWPHFSFRPSLIETSIFTTIGEFNIDSPHFEMEYGNRYANKNYKSAFLEGIYCKHIGRLTTERNDSTKLNAYKLNNEEQFTKTQSCNNKLQLKENILKYKIFVINLEKRHDRLQKFIKECPNLKQVINVYKAVNGSKLVSTPQLQRIFDGNNYNMRVGMVGCAMSHIDLMIKLINSKEDMFIIFEDDITFVPDFYQKLLNVFSQAKETDWDLIYLGHHLFQQYRNINDPYNKSKIPIIEKWDRLKSLKTSMGGTGGYIITRKGATKLLEFINLYGMTNGIDTVQQISADILNIYYCDPHLIYSECFMGNNKPDTDIQFNYKSLTVNLDIRLENEKKRYESIDEIDTFENAKKYIELGKTNEFPAFYKGTDNEIYLLVNKLNLPYYTLDNNILFIVPNPDKQGDNRLYFDRLKVGDKWDIQDALQYH